MISILNIPTLYQYCRSDAISMMVDVFTRDHLLCSPLVREKGEAKPVRRCRACKNFQVFCKYDDQGKKQFGGSCMNRTIEYD